MRFLSIALLFLVVTAHAQVPQEPWTFGPCAGLDAAVDADNATCLNRLTRRYSIARKSMQEALADAMKRLPAGRAAELKAEQVAWSKDTDFCKWLRDPDSVEFQRVTAMRCFQGATESRVFEIKAFQ